MTNLTRDDLEDLSRDLIKFDPWTKEVLHIVFGEVNLIRNLSMRFDEDCGKLMICF